MHQWKKIMGEHFTLTLQVSGPGLRWSGTCDGEVCVPQKRVRMPPSSQEAKGRLPEWHPVYVEVWQDRGHVLPHSRLWRLRSRQRQLPDTSQVGLQNLAVWSLLAAKRWTAFLGLSAEQKWCFLLVHLELVQSAEGIEAILWDILHSWSMTQDCIISKCAN